MDHLIRYQDGKLLAFALGEGKPIPPQALVDNIQVQRKSKFILGGRNFEHSLFAKKDQLVHTIFCNYLKWRMPLHYNDKHDKFIIDSSCDLVDVHMKDIILVAFTKHKSRTTFYLTDKNRRVPYLTNIYDTGNICINLSLEPSTPPASIISLIENTPGNGDLRTSNFLKMNESDGKVWVTHPTRGDIPHDVIPYIQDYV